MTELSAKKQLQIEFSHVFFSYGRTVILEDVNLQIFKRDLISVVGPNGGGKTTFLKLVLGLLKPDSGSISLLGGPPDQKRRLIGYMPQHIRYDAHFPVTVMDVVLMGRILPGMHFRYTSADRKAALETLEQLRLDHLATRLFSDLSGGQQQRVLIARALVTNPVILLLDEPTANVDAVAEAEFFSIIKKLNERMTIMMVSHDLGFVSEVVNRVVCINRKVVVHPTSEITGEIIQDIYGGDLRMIRHDHQCSIQGHSHV